MNADATADRSDAEAVLRALRRTRQVRDFTPEPVAAADLEAILDVARWSGSAVNSQPWTFILLRDRALRERIAGMSRSCGHVARASIAIAIAMPGENAEWDAYDEGRAAERIMVAARALGLGAAIGWTLGEARPSVSRLLGLEPPANVRTIVSIGHATPAAEGPKSAMGTARRPLDEVVREGPVR